MIGRILQCTLSEIIVRFSKAAWAAVPRFGTACDAGPPLYLFIYLFVFWASLQHKVAGP